MLSRTRITIGQRSSDCVERRCRI